MRHLRLLGLTVLLSTAGCYRYLPLDTAPPPPGSGVRLYLTPAGMEQLAPQLGAETTSVLGRVDSADSTALTLIVSETGKASGGTVRWVGERVVIPRAMVSRGELRALDRQRTLLASGATGLATAGAFLALRAASGGGGGDEGGGVGPVP